MNVNVKPKESQATKSYPSPKPCSPKSTASKSTPKSQAYKVQVES